MAIQAAAHDPRIEFAIIESTFCNLPEMARQQTANFPNPRLAWRAPFALSRAGKIANFTPSQVSPEQAIGTTGIPILPFHGTTDDVIPFEHGERISRHAKRANCRFVPIHGGAHYGLQQSDPETYRSELNGFLRRVTQHRQ